MRIMCNINNSGENGTSRTPSPTARAGCCYQTSAGAGIRASSWNAGRRGRRPLHPAGENGTSWAPSPTPCGETGTCAIGTFLQTTCASSSYQTRGVNEVLNSPVDCLGRAVEPKARNARRAARRAPRATMRRREGIDAESPFSTRNCTSVL